MNNTLEMLDVEAISVESNVGFNRRADDELLNSISVHGIITPITVRLSDGVPVVVAGHRRLNAAKKLGIKQIPAMVISAGGASEASLLAMQVAENITRANLTPVEELEAYQSVLELVSDEEAAQLLSKPVQRMHGVRAIMHSEKTQSALENVAGLDLFTAAELAGLEADPDVPTELVDETLKKLEKDPAKAQHLVAELQAEADKLRELSATVARLEKDGLKVVTPDTSIYYAFQGKGDKNFTPLSRLSDDGVDVTLESHANCGGHVVAVFPPRRSGEECELFYGCADWETWGHEFDAQNNASKPGISPKDAARRRAEDADVDAYERASILREKFIKNLLHREQLPAGFMVYAAEGMRVEAWRDKDTLVSFFGGVSREEFCSSPDHIIRLLVARSIHSRTLNSPLALGYWAEERVTDFKELLQWLQDAGYVLAPIEEEIFTGSYVLPSWRDWSEYEA